MYGLIGRRLGHSYSEPIHRALTNGAYDYRLIEVEPDALADFLKSRKFDGLNVTIPYKRAVIPFLDALTPDAERIGAVNTIFRRGDRWIGDNTDAAGLRYALERIGLDPGGRRCVISGNGGTSRTAAVVLSELGAASVRLVSRREGTPFERAGTLDDTELIVNATPLGMSPETDGDPLDLTLFPKLIGVFDAIYNPLSTRFLQRAQRLGLIQGCGLRMLVAQAKAAAERFLDARLDDGAIERVYRELRAGTENLILVGMPGAGKTAVGRALSALSGKPFVDLDAVFVERAGMPIPEYFARFGEAAFRQVEAELCAEVGRKTGQVVATGGGVVLREENRIHLRLNGYVVFLERELSKLPTSGRPVSQAAPSLRALYEERLPAYRACADVSVVNDGSKASVAARILELYRERLGTL